MGNVRCRAIKTYQDYAAIRTETGSGIPAFVEEAIVEHKSSDMCQTAWIAEQYDRQRNVTITNFRKMLYTMSGRAVPDNYSANHKMASNFFNRFITQEVQFELGNGVNFTEEGVKEALGRDFDTQLQKAARAALIGGLAFGFWNVDRLEVFSLTQFVPLWDEENGGLRAGIRYWKISEDKPLRATFYEEDGFTEYIKRKGDATLTVLRDKRPYRLITRQSVADGVEIYDGENYPGFPIVPLWGSPLHQSEIVGLREEIDCYDLIRSGFANDLDEASMFYWTLENCGGMDDLDLAKFVERMKTVRAAIVDGDNGAKATAHTLDVPYQSREVYLERLEQDMYKDFMAVDVSKIAAGSVTATQIMAAYEPLNNKCDQFEYCLIEFIDGILRIAGLDARPVFNRSQIVNQLEQTQMVLAAGTVLDAETVIRHIPWISPDEYDGILERVRSEELGMTPFRITEDDEGGADE